MEKIKLAIVGATGLVGRSVLQILEEKKFVALDYTLFASSRSAGSYISIRVKNL